MMEDELLQSRYRRYLTRRLELAEKEVGRLHSQANFLKSALMYRDRFRECLQFMDKYSHDIFGPSGGFRNRAPLRS